MNICGIPVEGFSDKLDRIGTALRGGIPADHIESWCVCYEKHHGKVSAELHEDHNDGIRYVVGIDESNIDDVIAYVRGNLPIDAILAVRTEPAEIKRA